MVNEPMPWNLTVAKLRDFLDRSQPHAIVAVAVSPDDFESIQAIAATARPAGLTVLFNLELASAEGEPAVTFRLRMDANETAGSEPPSQPSSPAS